MKTYYAPQQALHAPETELQNGAIVPYAERPERAASILEALGEADTPEDHGLAPILEVHDTRYIAFLKRAYTDWCAAGRTGDAFPYVFPVRGRRSLSLDRIDAELGQYAYDCGTPISEHTWTSAYWNAQTVLSALDHVLAGNKRAFALCRPPGHHAGSDYMGGYCYLNSVAICARAAMAKGTQRVAILDVDYHHGNGTQDIFYTDHRVLTVSIHADPKIDYPFYWGHPDETGSGQGVGFNLNLALPRGTRWDTYHPNLKQACDRVAAFAPDLLIVPFGADTFIDDPISFFCLRSHDYAEMGQTINSLNIPTLISMEGGYAINALGANVYSFLSGFGDAAG